MAKHALDIEIRGDMAELNGALKELNAGLRLTNGEISAVKKELKFDPSSVELLTQQQDHLQDALVLSTKKAEALRRQLESPNVEVGSQEYVRLSTQLSTAQSAARNYERQLQQVNGTLSRINRTGESFRLNTDSVHTFSSTLSGVNAALTRLGGFRRIEGFDTSRASAHELAQYAARVSDTLSVLTRKSEILESALEHIDPNVDVREFQRLQNALNETRDQIEALNRRRVEIPVNINSNQTSGAFTQLGAKLSQGISSISSVIGPPAQAVGGAAMRAISASFSAGLGLVKGVLNGIGTIGLEALRTAGSMMASAAKSIFSAVGDVASAAIKAPFHLLGAALNQITIGALRQVGGNIINGINTNLKGVVKQMNDTVKSTASLTSVLNFSGVDSSKIQEINKDLQDYARTATTPTDSLNKVVASLSAAGVETNKLSSTTKNIANAYKLLGDGSQDVSNIGVIFSQINSAGKLMAQDFNQLRNAGLGGAIQQDISQHFPEIIAQFGSFHEAMAKGAISSDMVMESINRIGSSDAAVKAATVPKTMGEAFETLQETIAQKFQNVFVNLNTRGINFVQSFADAISGMDFSAVSNAIDGIIAKLPSIITVARNIFSQIPFSDILNAVKQTFTDIQNYIKELFDNSQFQSALTIMKSALDNLVQTFGNLKNVFTQVFDTQTVAVFSEAFASLLNSIAVLLNLLTSSNVFKNFFTSLSQGFKQINFADVFSNITAELIKIGSAIASVINSTQFQDGISSVINTVKGLYAVFMNVKNAIASAFDGDAISATFANIMSLVSSFTSTLQQITSSEGFSTFMQTAFASVDSIINNIINNVRTLSESISSAFSGLSFDTLSSTLESLKNIINEIVTAVQVTLSAAFAELKKQNVTDIFDRLNQAGNDIANTFSNLGPLFKAFGAIATIVGVAWLSVVEALIGVGAAIGALVAKLDFTAYIDAVRNFASIIVGFFNGLRDGFTSSLQTAGPYIEVFQQGLNTLSNALSRLFKFIKPVTDTLGKFIGWIAGEALKGSLATLGLLADAIGKIVDVITKLLDGIAKFGKAAWDFLVGLFGGSNNSATNYSAGAAAVSSYAAVSTATYSTRNTFNFNVTASQGMDTTTLARQIKHEFMMGTA